MIPLVIYCFPDPNQPNPLLVLFGLILVVVVIYSYLNLKKNNLKSEQAEISNLETDVLGLEKTIPVDRSDYTNIKSIFNLQHIILFGLLLLGLILIFNNRPQYKPMDTGSHWEADKIEQSKPNR